MLIFVLTVIASDDRSTSEGEQSLETGQTTAAPSVRPTSK